MVTKKDALILGVLAIGGIAAASAVAGDDEISPGMPKSSLSGGALDRILNPDLPPTAGFQIPPPAQVTFPEPVDYTDFLRDFFTTQGSGSTETEGGGATKKETQMYGGLAVPSHYPKNVVEYAKTQYKPKAFLTGLTQEQANISYLASHPSLMLSPTGKIVSRYKKYSRGTGRGRGSSSGGSKGSGGYTGHSGTKKGAGKAGTSRYSKR